MDSIIAFAQSLHLVVQLDAATDSFFAGEETHFSVGFCWDWFGFCRCADGVGDDPTGAGQSDADRVAGPIEVIPWPGGQIGNPDQQLEDHDLRGEEARGKRRHDAGEDGYGGAEKAQGGGIGPEHPRRRQPTRDPGQQAGHVNDVDDAEGDGANTEEEHEKGSAARNK